MIRSWLVSPASMERTRSLCKHLISGRFDMRRVVHPLSKLRQLPVHAAPGTALIAQRAMFGEAVPWVERQIAGEGELLGRIKFLPWDAQPRGRHERGKPLR